MSLNDFYTKTTKKFTVTITYNSSNPNITSDTVSIFFRQRDVSPQTVLIDVDADVSGGSSGVASFTLTTSDTTVLAGNYEYIIQWVSATNGTFVLESADIQLVENYSV